MERDSKRKAQSQPMIDYETPRSNKRQKLPGDLNSSDETPETTTEAGLRFLTSLKNAKDKTGRIITIPFLHLPDKKTPGYYEAIKLPIALDTIEDKLNDRLYPNLSAVESDLKRLVANAKSFNEKGSDLYEDVERVRKQASNWMTRHNPAYRDKNYVAIATPIPGESKGAADTPRPSREVVERVSRPGRRSSAPAPAPDPEPEDDEDAEGEDDDETAEVETKEKKVVNLGKSLFKGLSFQKAQVALIEHFIKYQEDELDIFEPFLYLPSRQLTDYYQLIKHPVSLKGLEKRIHGRHGRLAATEVSDFQTWDALEIEASYIWDNCREYNEDGSEMYELASEFETMFREKIEEARNVVPQPQQQKLKLKLGQAKSSGIKIKFGSGRDSPTSTPGPSTPGERGTPIVTNADAGVNGTRPALTNGDAKHTSQTSRSVSAMSPPAQTNGIKHESSATPSRGQSQAHTAYRPPIPQHGPPGLNISAYRPIDQKPSDYLIPSVHISTHPSLSLSKPLSVKIKASPKIVQQSVTFELPASHYHLQIVPHLPVASTNLPYRFFVLVNNSKVSETIKPGGERDRENPMFEARLERGAVHRIDVEVLAVKPAEGDAKEEVRWEKTTCLINLARN